MVKQYYSNELYHHGVKGMKWGVRNEQQSIGNGLTLRRNKLSAPARLLRKVNPNIAKEQDKTYDYTVLSGKKKVGNLTLYQESANSVNVTWIGIKNKERGKHYASTVMDWTIKTAKANGNNQLTLEVPSNSPDARHVYEKRGFVAGKQISSSDDIWDGLTAMKKKL